ncbi:hypothetical protein BUALT_Bualt19G0129500 [Buddleja alternifolia]|uniref:Uncharacterized protein n=1 Tax=Buddleja alternifolia TaxID=168488 RepID=A0AAV6W9T7_9LAMI|nr:hypothetical protein BUALT_Bualt19G0129500 [Buddleja alternifolia]
MISTPLRSKILGHTRSISLPSRSHPLIPQFNEHLHRVKACDSTTPSSSLSSITRKLNNLDDVYNCVDDLLALPHTQQVFTKESQEKWVEETLDGYLRVVDACSTAKDIVSHGKQYVLDLLSALRRRRDSDDLCTLLASRKMAKKMIQKSLRNISSFKNKPTILALEKDHETIAIISMLKEAESTTLEVIEELFLSISGTKGPTGWSLVSRLMSSRKVSGQEFEEMDAALCKLLSFKISKSGIGMHIDYLQHLLRETESSIEIVEETLQRLFKRLIKTRVSLLNMHSQ